MANRHAPSGLKRYAIGALILILIAWALYAANRGPSTPGPAATQDGDAAPSIRP
ncbi:MAG TPA: hypothetical protein VMY76_13905 [Gemmatimonadales bacterium]|nr:hypothetical protein [Gemmatimonadales bacterium]